MIRRKNARRERLTSADGSPAPAGFENAVIDTETMNRISEATIEELPIEPTLEVDGPEFQIRYFPAGPFVVWTITRLSDGVRVHRANSPDLESAESDSAKVIESLSASR